MKSPSCLFGWAFCLALKQILCTFFSRNASSDELKFKSDWLRERQHMFCCLSFILLTKGKPFVHRIRALNPSFETDSHSLLSLFSISLPSLFFFFFSSSPFFLFHRHFQWHLAILPKIEKWRENTPSLPSPYYLWKLSSCHLHVELVLRKIIKKAFEFSWWFSLKKITSSYPREKGGSPAS